MPSNAFQTAKERRKDKKFKDKKLGQLARERESHLSELRRLGRAAEGTGSEAV